MDITKKFGKQLKKIRTKKGISQEQLAELSNLHRTYISFIECGKRNITISNIQKIAKALKVKISDLVKGL